MSAVNELSRVRGSARGMMSATPAVITGLGPVSAIGSGKTAFWENLIAGRHGFGPITRCDVSQSPSTIGAEVKDFCLGEFIENGSAIARRTPRSVQFALAAGALALHDAKLLPGDGDRDRIGIHIGSSVANLAETFALRDRFLSSGRVAPHTAFNTFNHAAACMLSALFDLRGPSYTTTTGCNSGMDALGQSLYLLQAGVVDGMLVIGTDCELVPELFAVLNASGSLSTRYNDEPGRASRPFDVGRDGNVIGEGAAALFIETEAAARERGVRSYARVAGYAMCSAGRNRQYSHSQPELDLQPAVRALRGAASQAGWDSADVDLVNANGSSSVRYDAIEARAFAATFGERFADVPVHSIKSMLGQHGAGSSALQLVASALTIATGTAPPTINHDEPDPACGPIRVLTGAEQLQPRRVLVHSIGLGGFYYSCAALTTEDGARPAAAAAHDGDPFAPWPLPERGSE